VPVSSASAEVPSGPGPGRGAAADAGGVPAPRRGPLCRPGSRRPSVGLGSPGPRVPVLRCPAGTGLARPVRRPRPRVRPHGPVPRPVPRPAGSVPPVSRVLRTVLCPGSRTRPRSVSICSTSRYRWVCRNGLRRRPAAMSCCRGHPVCSAGVLASITRSMACSRSAVSSPACSVPGDEKRTVLAPLWVAPCAHPGDQNQAPRIIRRSGGRRHGESPGGGGTPEGELRTRTRDTA
jgi:hypothetical protein